MNKKELAIKVAEKLGEVYDFTGDGVNGFFGLYPTMFQPYEISNYLNNKAWQVLSSEGMAGKISNFLRAKKLNNDSEPPMDWFWRGVENDGTLTPRKILEVWLEMDE